MMLFRALATIMLLIWTSAVEAQAPLPAKGDDDAPVIAEALKALEDAGNTVIVVPPAAIQPAAPAEPFITMSTISQRVATIGAELGTILAGAPELPTLLVAALRAAGGGSLHWLIRGAILTALAFAVGALAAHLAHRLMLRLARGVDAAPPDTRAGMIARSIAILLRQGASAVAFLVAGTLAALLIHPELSPERVTATMAVGSATVFLLVRAVLYSVLSPRPTARRPLPFSDAIARSLYIQLMVTGAIANIVALICYWLAYFPLPGLSHRLLLLIAPTASVLLFLAVVAAHHNVLTAAILEPAPRPRPLRRFLAIAWPVILVGYLLGAWVLTIVGVVESTRLAVGPVLSPFVAMVVAMGVAGVLIIVYDRRLSARVMNPAWKALYEETALALAALAGAATLAAIWRVFTSPFADAARTVFGLALLLILANATWRAIRLYVAIRLADEAPAGGATEGEGEGFGPGGSRLGTLLPILRNVLFFVILAIVVMVGLSSLGVDIGPLFAGAGVAGLAIGFGAQALIRDVFSGAFFLLDDAFRRGEYVEVGAVAGMVEKISVRSFQLRHHEGALHTIPFGEIKQLTNFSRDWVIMKLPVRLTYDTDVERVRRLVKKLGQEMAADEAIGPLFLEPPKSQGVVQMEDSAMIVRVKFKTRPGDQFLVRRHVFQRLRDLFAENDIHFAHREVTVRVAGADDEETRRKAALGAVRSGDVDTADAASDFFSTAR